MNQISSSDKVTNHANTVAGTFLQNLNNTQCQQLMSLLSTYLSSAAKVHDSLDIPSTSYSSSIYSFIFLNQPFVSFHIWIVDSGASKHICSHAHLFTPLTPISNYHVTLANHVTIPVQYSGDVVLSPYLTLKEVLFMPQFYFNLISVSTLTNDCNLMLDFFRDCSTIPEICN